MHKNTTFKYEKKKNLIQCCPTVKVAFIAIYGKLEGKGVGGVSEMTKLNSVISFQMDLRSQSSLIKGALGKRTY